MSEAQKRKPVTVDEAAASAAIWRRQAARFAARGLTDETTAAKWSEVAARDAAAVPVANAIAAIVAAERTLVAAADHAATAADAYAAAAGAVSAGLFECFRAAQDVAVARHSYNTVAAIEGRREAVGLTSAAEAASDAVAVSLAERRKQLHIDAQRLMGRPVESTEDPAKRLN
jgi:uncharacterized cupin superfamily protein